MRNISVIYDQTIQEYTDGKISREQATARLITIKNKESKPEDISIETINDSLDFSPEYIKAQAEAFLSAQKCVTEKEIIIKQLEDEKESQKKANKDLETENKRIKQEIIRIKEENKSQAEILEKQKKRKEKRRTIIKKFLMIIGYFILLFVLVCFLRFLLKGLDLLTINAISICMGILGIIIPLISIRKKKKKEEKNSEEFRE